MSASHPRPKSIITALKAALKIIRRRLKNKGTLAPKRTDPRQQLLYNPGAQPMAGKSALNRR
jgi:hypothetical protein